MVEERVFCASSTSIGVAIWLGVVPVQIENILKNLLVTFGILRCDCLFRE